MRVSLITTGIMELNGLAAALRRLFPDHDFQVEPDAPGKPFDGFTSCKVLPLSPADPPGKAVTMLRAALGTLLAADTTTPASDFAVILEDLELCNRGNEDVLIEHVRESARRVLAGIGPAGEPLRAAKLFRERVSFHLAVPMPESWFFGDLTALKTEVPETAWPPALDTTRDPEDFRTKDPVYLADEGAACTALVAKAALGAKKKRPDWVTDRRDEHPKHYLQWLMRAPEKADCTTYKEQHEGVRLLAKLDWPTVLATGTWFPYLRALVRDLEAALGPSPCGLPPGGEEAPRTSLSILPTNPVLRNL